VGQKRLTRDQLDAVTRLYAEGMSMAEVGGRLGLSIGAVHYRLRIAGVARRKRADYRSGARSPEELARIITLYRAGGSLRRVAAQMSISSESVRQVLKRAGMSRRSSGDYHRTYLSRAELQRVARLYESGMSAASVGRTLGLGGSKVIYRLHRLGIEVRPAGHYGRVSKDELKRTGELYASGLTGTEVAQRLGLGLPTVYARLRRMGVPRRPRGVRKAAW